MDTISIKEYAEIEGISVQAIYKKLKSPQFQPYIQRSDDGKVMLDAAVLDDVKINRNAEKHSTRFPTVESTVEQPFKVPESQGKQDTDSTVHSTVEQPLNQPFKTTAERVLVDVLNERIKDKDEEIKRLTAQLTAKDEQIKRITDSLQFEQRRSAALSDDLKLLQGKIEEQEQAAAATPAEDQPKQSWWYRFWHSTAPGK